VTLLPAIWPATATTTPPANACGYNHAMMLYEFPEFDNKSQIAAHAAAISNLRSVLKNEVDANSLITSSYNDKWNAINTIYDQYVVYAYNAQETYDNEATKSNLNYLNVYVE